MADPMNQDKNVVHFVKFTSCVLERIALVVVVLLDQIHGMLSQEKNYDQKF